MLLISVSSQVTLLAIENGCNPMPSAESWQVPDARSRNMAAIKAKNTKPEMLVRHLLHAMGYRFRLHYAGLPGRPDLAFPARMKVIEVRGCFWHQHADPRCHNAVLPATRREWWRAKLKSNAARDRKNLRKIKKLGWSALVLWECELEDQDILALRIRNFLGQPGGSARTVDRSKKRMQLAQTPNSLNRWAE